jgi:Ca2+-binding EF-hand superfamily protein
MEQAYELFEVSGLMGSGLDLVGILKGLLEMGLQGVDREEWEMIQKVILTSVSKKYKHDDNSCNLFSFAVIVHAVRSALKDHRKHKLENTTSKIRRDWETGKLDYHAMLKSVLDVFPLEADTAEPSKSIPLAAELCKEFSSHETGHMNDLVSGLQNLAEEEQRAAHQEQRRIKDEFRINGEIFEFLRPRLLVLHKLFQRLCKNLLSLVDAHELTIVFSEILDAFPNDNDREYMNLAMSMVTEHCPVNFSAFLRLHHEINVLIEPYMDPHVAHVKRFFDQRQVDDDEFDDIAPYIRQEDMELIFKDAGQPVDDPEVRSIMRRMISKADMEGRGRIMLDQLKKQYRLFRERLRLHQVWSKYCLAEKLGFAVVEMRDIENIYNRLDEDHSKLLERGEVREACQMLNVDVGKDAHFDVAFSMLDTDNDGGLNFFEFIRFLKMVRDHDGPFKNPETTSVSTLKALDRMDLMLLMKCFDDHYFDDHKGKHEGQLLTDACTLLEVESATPLTSALNVKTLQELFEHAKWRVQEARQKTTK